MTTRSVVPSVLHVTRLALLGVVCAALALTACPDLLEADPPPDLPERVLFRTATESFNDHWYVAVREGRIWIKANEQTAKREGGWELIGRSGLPEGDGLVRFEAPTEVVEVSVDGCHIQALSSDGVFYRGTDMRKDVRRSLTWTDKWGWFAGNGEGLTAEFGTGRGWSVSDSHPFDVDHYEDILGTEHSVGMGVAHLYRLDESGRRILFNDWWLPNDWSRTICGPERGTVEAVNISASGSTLFVVGADGALHTRLYDFDTAGENDLYTYSFVLDGPAGSTRALPAEPWRRQPAPDGRITSSITIFQDGQGNAARVLRVQGEQAGEPGLFEKRIDDPDWTFVPTGEPIAGPFLDAPRLAPIEPAGPDDRVLEVVLGKEDLDTTVTLRIEDFNLLCSPARVTLIDAEGAAIPAGGEPVELTLHHVHTMVTEPRPFGYWEQDVAAVVRAALVIPDSIGALDDAAAAELLGDRRVINLVGTAHPDALDLEEIPRSMSFRVPYAEKGVKGRLYSIR
jgi:hypothetical protein